MEGFQELLRIPSISTDPAYKAELERCAEWLVAEMTRIGLHNCRKIPTDGHPVVYGEWLEAGDDKPTVVIYAHYDVQPVDPLNLWATPPFEPTLRDGKLYARGAAMTNAASGPTSRRLKRFSPSMASCRSTSRCFSKAKKKPARPNMPSFVAANKDLLEADLLTVRRRF